MKFVIIAVVILLICCIAGAVMAIANAALYMDDASQWSGWKR